MEWAHDSVNDANEAAIITRHSPLDVEKVPGGVDFEQAQVLRCYSFTTHASWHFLVFEDSAGVLSTAC